MVGGYDRHREILRAGLTVAPGATVRFEPNHFRLMLKDLTQPLKTGEPFPLTLEFARQDPIGLDVRVEQGPEPWAKAGMHHH